MPKLSRLGAGPESIPIHYFVLDRKHFNIGVITCPIVIGPIPAFNTGASPDIAHQYRHPIAPAILTSPGVT